MIVHVKPPASLPVAQVREITRIIADGKVREEYKCLTWCAQDVQLYGTALLIGPPEGHEHESFGSTGDEPEQLDECIASLESAHAQLSGGTYGNGEDAVGLDPATIALIVQAVALAIEVLKLLRRSK